MWMVFGRVALVAGRDWSPDVRGHERMEISVLGCCWYNCLLASYHFTVYSYLFVSGHYFYEGPVITFVALVTFGGLWYNRVCAPLGVMVPGCSSSISTPKQKTKSSRPSITCHESTLSTEEVPMSGLKFPQTPSTIPRTQIICRGSPSLIEKLTKPNPKSM